MTISDTPQRPKPLPTTTGIHAPALVGAIAYKRCGPNAQAADYFDLMTLGTIPGDEDQ